MALLYHCKWEEGEQIRADLAALIPDVDIRIWPDVGDPAEIEVAVVWKLHHGELARFPNLKAILSPGAGVDHLFEDPDLPAGVPIARLVDPLMSDRMAEYTAALTLWSHREFDAYADLQRRKIWQQVPQKDARTGGSGSSGWGRWGKRRRAACKPSASTCAAGAVRRRRSPGSHRITETASWPNSWPAARS